MVKGMAVIWGCTLDWCTFLPAGMITHWACRNTGRLPTALPPAVKLTCTHRQLRRSKTLWPEGLEAHRGAIHSHCASLPVLHQSLISRVLRCHDIHTGAAQKMLSSLSSPWMMGNNRKHLLFWYLKTSLFPFPLNPSFTGSTVLLKAHKYPSSLCFIFLFFLLLSPPTLGLVLMFPAISFQHSRALVYFAAASLSLLRFPTYRWSHCSFPGRSPTPRSPGFSLPAGPGRRRRKTPVQAVHRRTYLYWWFTEVSTIQCFWKLK